MRTSPKRSRGGTISGIHPSGIPAEQCWRIVCRVGADSLMLAGARAWWGGEKRLIIRDIIDVQVQDVVTTSARSILDAGVQSADEVRRQPASLIRYSDELLEANRELRRFLYQNVYYHPRVAEVNERACEMLRKVFETYLVDPERLGEAAAKRIEKEGLQRTVCDYIAGMTDRYLIEEYARIRGL